MSKIDTMNDKSFLANFFYHLGELILKLVRSRKAFFQIISKAMTIYLILSLKNELYILLTFLISSIVDFIYFGVILFEKVNTNIDIGVGK